MNDTLKALLTRRSVRQYTDKMPSNEDISLILDAGRYAPTGMNSQNTMAVVVKNKELRDRLSKINAAVMGADKDPFYGAPVVIVVFADTARYTYLEDGSLAMGNMLNAAHSLGLASCWIHRAGQMFDSTEGRELARSWGVPDSYKGIGNLILGYSGGPLPDPKPRKEGFSIIIE